MDYMTFYFMLRYLSLGRLEAVCWNALLLEDRLDVGFDRLRAVKIVVTRSTAKPVVVD